MSLEQRMGRVEEAVVVMKDLLANHNDRPEKYFLALEKERGQRAESLKNFNAKLNATKNVLVSHNERLEKYFFALENERLQREESRHDFEFKLNALIDAQMKNEEAIRDLRDASRSQLSRIEKLEDR